MEWKRVIFENILDYEGERPQTYFCEDIPFTQPPCSRGVHIDWDIPKPKELYLEKLKKKKIKRNVIFHVDKTNKENLVVLM